MQTTQDPLTYRRNRLVAVSPGGRLTSLRSVIVLLLASVVAIGLTLLAPQAQPAQALKLGSGFTTRGVPTTGKALFGAIVQNLEKTAAMEAAHGAKLGVRRTYWNAGNSNASVKHAKADLEAGRLPWMSYKVPHSWAKMASGAGDAWAKDLANKLGALPGPVWVAFVHEPENDSGSAADWKRMQQRLSPIMRAKPNIGYTIILMGYHQFFANNGKGTPGKTMADYWPGKQHVDVAGFDPYNWYGTNKGSGTNNVWTELKQYYAKFKSWSQANGNVAWAVAETGYTHVAAQKDGAWLTRAYDDLKAYGGAALAYFDIEPSFIGAHPSRTWPLTTAPKKTAFKNVLKRADRLVG